MRQALWVVNSSLLLLFLLSQIVFVFLQVAVPRRVSLQPDVVQKAEEDKTFVVDIKRIYENDLFGTYIPPVPVVEKLDYQIPIIPDEPREIPLKIPIEVKSTFVAPLSVTLKGVVYLHDDQENSAAIVQFQDSKEEINYKIGDLINDAQVLKVFPNRVIVVRSNGQQETLYLREEDAASDLAAQEHKDIGAMIIVVKDGKYHIPIDKFVAQVSSLGQLIDLLDLTTVYKKGKSIGCRVGNANKDSLGVKLGLEFDDIITQVDALEVHDLASRVKVYDHILGKGEGQAINVTVKRAGKDVKLTYVLGDQVLDKGHVDTYHAQQAAKHDGVHRFMNEYELNRLEDEKKKLLEKRVKLAPTAHQLQLEEQRKLIDARRRNVLSNGVPGKLPGMVR